MKRYFLTYILLCILSFTASSCKDDLLYNGGEVGEGECVISGTVKFKSFTPALNGSTRAEDVTGGTKGDAIKQINSLCVLLYGENKKLLDKYFLMPKDATGADGADGVYEVKNNVPRAEGEHKDNGYTDADGKPLPPAEAETPRATFTLKIPYGKYHIYAVANMGNLSEFEELIQDVDGLKSIPLQWNKGNIAANSQMFGHFFSDTNTENEPLLTIDKTSKKLQAWVRRAASKVTVAYDGSGLKEGVSIYIKALRIKNIPKSCWLGKDNKVGQASGGEDSEGEGNEGETNQRAGDEGGTETNLVIPTGEVVTYSTSTAYDEKYPALITKEQPYYPREEKQNEDGTTSWVMDPDAHSEFNPHSLFFYENMQGSGKDKSQLDVNNDGILDELYPYQEKPYATYIEVDAYYESSNPERPGICNITYRFMLGQNITTDYNAKRNCHYKLTLHFNGFADEPDWRIDYVTRLWVTQPETVDYRGKYFVPDNVSSNQGNNFSDENIITVTSIMYNRDSWFDRIPVRYKIEYKDAGKNEFTETPPNWLGEFTTTAETDKKGEETGVYKLKINYKNPYTSVNINNKLEKADPKAGIYDLSTKGGTEMNTANCYIVDAKGTYKFPLVYGNAITGGGENSYSYTYQGTTTAENNAICLGKFLNYNGEAITSPYILTDIYKGDIPAGLTASLVWQDEPGLIADIQYKRDLFPCGGIQFSIGNIKEGNAVIALKDPSGKIMWSWHIWVTAIDFSRKITINRPNIETKNDKGEVIFSAVAQDFEIMPVNLGWCSGGDSVRYYDRHECEVRFTQLINKVGEPEQLGMSKVVKIIQEPHIAVPCGNNPYFQWGRKDPFVAGGNASGTTKTWYDAQNSSQSSAPALMYTSNDGTGRVYTYKATASLIQNPDKWQNGPREETGNSDIPYRPNDIIYFNLWDNSCWDGNDYVTKTIYDPCPVGYHVSSIYTFSGFTDTGISIGSNWQKNDITNNMYAATEENMMPEINGQGKKDANYQKYRNRIFEFYTNKTKLISIGFPTNGYRDWEDYAKLLKYDEQEGQIWHAQAVPFSWAKPYNAYHFEYNRHPDISHIWPSNNFYATDGFPVRPTKTLP